MNLEKHIYYPIFKIISKAADELNLETFVVGGFVRDLILKRKNPTDLDFVCIGSGIDLAKKVAEHLNANDKVQVFKNFGTVGLFFLMNSLSTSCVSLAKQVTLKAYLLPSIFQLEN